MKTSSLRKNMHVKNLYNQELNAVVQAIDELRSKACSIEQVRDQVQPIRELQHKIASLLETAKAA